MGMNEASLARLTKVEIVTTYLSTGMTGSNWRVQ